MTGPNRSTAVMQRRSEPHNSLDDFPTPPWATRALCEWIWARFSPGPLTSVREPACNRGHMVRPLSEYFGRVEGSDVHDYGAGFPVQDYLFGPPPERTEWTITNPPFRLAAQFIERARQCSRYVAMLVRSAFTEGVGRFKTLFSQHRPMAILQFTARVVIHRGKLTATGSTATAYCWVVWGAQGVDHTEFDWIPPCRRRLERPGDYPAEPSEKDESGPCLI